MRLRRSRGVLPVAGGRCRPAARVHFSGRRDAGLPQFQRLQGICRGEPARWLECMGHVRDFACRAHTNRTAAKGNDHQITRPYTKQEIFGRSPEATWRSTTGARGVALSRSRANICTGASRGADGARFYSPTTQKELCGRPAHEPYRQRPHNGLLGALQPRLSLGDARRTGNQSSATAASSVRDMLGGLPLWPSRSRFSRASHAPVRAADRNLSSHRCRFHSGARAYRSLQVNCANHIACWRTRPSQPSESREMVRQRPRILIGVAVGFELRQHHIGHEREQTGPTAWREAPSRNNALAPPLAGPAAAPGAPGGAISTPGGKKPALFELGSKSAFSRPPGNPMAWLLRQRKKSARSAGSPGVVAFPVGNEVPGLSAPCPWVRAIR